MNDYTCFDLVEWGQPLEERRREFPVPDAKGVVVRVTAAGICHSDLHFKKGYLDLGEQGKLTFTDRGARLPATMGHEIAGEVVSVGSDVSSVSIGQSVLVFPWIGCRKCAACEDARESDCMSMRIIGVSQPGGYATHVYVEDEQFLVDITGLDPAEVAPHACSGLTVYNAFEKMGPLRDKEWLAVLGAGGLGLNAIAIANALGYGNIVAVDIDDDKLDAAREMGAHAILNNSLSNAVEALREITGNQLFGVLDTFGGASTAELAIHTLSKSGTYLVVGQHGGDFKMPQPWLPQKAITVRGSHVGNSSHLREVIDLVRTGKVRQMPIERRPLSDINEVMDDLQSGKVRGRIVLVPD